MHFTPRLALALAAYAILGFSAWQTLDGRILKMTWLILGAFAIRTIVVALRPPTD
jgi:hypothetical protein